MVSYKLRHEVTLKALIEIQVEETVKTIYDNNWVYTIIRYCLAQFSISQPFIALSILLSALSDIHKQVKINKNTAGMLIEGKEHTYNTHRIINKPLTNR